jgi:hypothetical protein
VLFGKGLLQPNNQYYNWYIIGIGLGTMAGMTVFIVGGQLLMSKMNTHRTIINYSIAAIFGITALIFLGKILLNKGAANALRSKGLVVDDEPEA